MPLRFFPYQPSDGIPNYLLLPRATASLASRSAVRRRSVSRLSQSCLPLASASSTFTLPFLKYIRVGMSVSPLCCVLPISLRISSLCMSSLRVRSGAWLKMLPCSYGPMWQLSSHQRQSDPGEDFSPDSVWFDVPAGAPCHSYLIGTRGVSGRSEIKRMSGSAKAFFMLRSCFCFRFGQATDKGNPSPESRL